MSEQPQAAHAVSQPLKEQPEVAQPDCADSEVSAVCPSGNCAEVPGPSSGLQHQSGAALGSTRGPPPPSLTEPSPKHEARSYGNRQLGSLFLELFAGTERMSKAFARVGFQVIAVDSVQAQAVPSLARDLSRPANQKIVFDLIKSQRLAAVHLAPPCGTSSRGTWIADRCEMQDVGWGFIPLHLPGADESYTLQQCLDFWHRLPSKIWGDQIVFACVAQHETHVCFALQRFQQSSDFMMRYNGCISVERRYQLPVMSVDGLRWHSFEAAPLSLSRTGLQQMTYSSCRVSATAWLWWQATKTLSF